ncbi:MAG: YgjV family protein [Ruminococcaceae bacterium]|nr:YgjV family protein [Oscillospiraceae bacterium]
MAVLSFVLSITGLISMITASLLKGKNMRKILVLVFLGNTLVATSYLIDQNANGAASCYIGAAQTIINYFFESKNKKLPIWLIIAYSAAFVVINLMVFTEFVDIMAIIASLTFIMCIGQKNGRKYRIWTLINMILWSSYDIIKGSYAPLVTHAIMLAFNVVGMIIHDTKKKKA